MKFFLNYILNNFIIGTKRAEGLFWGEFLFIHVLHKVVCVTIAWFTEWSSHAWLEVIKKKLAKIWGLKGLVGKKIAATVVVGGSVNQAIKKNPPNCAHLFKNNVIMRNDSLTLLGCTAAVQCFLFCCEIHFHNGWSANLEVNLCPFEYLLDM